MAFFFRILCRLSFVKQLLVHVDLKPELQDLREVPVLMLFGSRNRSGAVGLPLLNRLE